MAAVNVKRQGVLVRASNGEAGRNFVCRDARAAEELESRLKNDTAFAASWFGGHWTSGLNG